MKLLWYVLPAILAIGTFACGSSPSETSTNSSSSAASGMGGAGGEGGTGHGVGGAWVSDADITNNPLCDDWTGLYPVPSEFGQFAATRLTPPSYPYSIIAIRYHLSDITAFCKELPHRTFLFVESSAIPGATPQELTSWDVAADSAAEDGWVEHTLAAPIVLDAEEHLFIAVEMTGDGREVLCLSACAEAAGASVHAPERNFWSNATEPPYVWAALETFDVLINLHAEAFGSP